MRLVVVLLAVACCCDAKPMMDGDGVPRATFGTSPHIIGGTDALPGEFPWQLSQQRLSGTSTWSHSCGASLLSSKYALSASHCVDGAAANILRVIAGLHNQTKIEEGVISDVISYKMHENYDSSASGYPNDISILTLATPIAANGGRIQYALLPLDNSNTFAGQQCVLSGWGRTGVSNQLPDILQKVSIPVITTAQCNSALSGVSGVSVTDNQICVFDDVNRTGSCNGDSGGPMNCVDGSQRTVVAGCTSWGISSLNVCRPAYPSVYTRTSAYLDWIATNTP